MIIRRENQCRFPRYRIYLYRARVFINLTIASVAHCRVPKRDCSDDGRNDLNGCHCRRNCCAYRSLGGVGLRRAMSQDWGEGGNR